MSGTPKIKLTYFDFPGGRGEPARIALAIGKVPFEDERIKFADWPARKPKTPFGGLPMIEVNGEPISQSNAINRFVGKLSGLYPEDTIDALKCDEVCDAVEAMSDAMALSFSLKGDEQKRERERLVHGVFPTYLRSLEAILARRGPDWFVCGRLTMADLKVADIVRMLGSGRLDHVPTDIVDRLAPGLVAHRRRVLEHPAVRAYTEASRPA